MAPAAGQPAEPSGGPGTYRNPVLASYLGDPFVLRAAGGFYAFGTQPLGPPGIPAYRSEDLVHWEPLGDVLERLPAPVDACWAPEVAYANGRFWMYFSGGGAAGEGHGLRVASAPVPEGPYRLESELLPDEPFSIDPHPFRDDDGSWWLFHCRDVLEGERAGTGVVVSRLRDMRTLDPAAAPVVLPYADWNVFERDRLWYGRRWPAWHTIEGPFVRRRAGRLVCLFSGGAWHSDRYGMGYAVADRPAGPWRVVEPTAGPSVLRTVPGRVLGPGHASLVLGPDGLQEWIAYHAWDPASERRSMRIDRLRWEDGEPRCDGPSLDERPAPRLPLVREAFGGAALDAGRWTPAAGLPRPVGSCAGSRPDARCCACASRCPSAGAAR